MMTAATILAAAVVGGAIGAYAHRLDRAYGEAEAPHGSSFAVWSWLSGAGVLAGATSLLATVLGATPAGALACGTMAGLLAALIVLDLRHLMLPDLLTGAVALLGFARAVGPTGPTVLEGVTGALLAVGLLLGLRAALTRLRGVEALGLGDVKLAAGAGLWCGWTGLPYVLIIACALTLALALATGGSRPLRTREVPLGPGLAVGLGIVAALPPIAGV
jgi:leader peptidase (prepilin peptidase)/N-methyltransferase